MALILLAWLHGRSRLLGRPDDTNYMAAWRSPSDRMAAWHAACSPWPHGHRMAA